MSVVSIPPPRPVPLRALGWAFLFNMLWINASEVFRYFAFVMPMMRAALPEIADVAPMNISVFLVWGIWDTILVLTVTFTGWLMLDRFGTTTRVVVAAGTALWVAIFVILWLGVFNMNLATPRILGIALPLAWFEMVVAVLIVRWALQRDAGPPSP